MNPDSSSNRDQLQRIWKQFIQNETLEENYLPKHIFSSWIRSKDANVDPHQALQEIPHISQFFNIDALNSFLSHLLPRKEHKKLADRLVQLDCSIFLYNTECHYFACFYEHGNELKGQQHIALNMEEALIGTNAVTCCLRERKVCSVTGEEHYNANLKNTAGYAVPYKNHHNEVSGVIYVVSDISNANPDILSICTQLSAILEKNSVLQEMLSVFQLYLTILEGMMQHTTDVKLFVDEFEVVHGFNQKALDLLEINKSSVNFRQKILEKLKQINAYRPNDFHEELVILKSKTKQRSLLASNQKLKLPNRSIGTIVSLVDIEGLAKWGNKIKGNEATYTFDHIVGETQELVQLKEMAKKVARTSSHVLVNGESGTGKELLAQSIHNESSRSDQPFIAINCGAMPSELIESELFGYEAGTFTGASKKGKVGKMEFASGGTLFLDEIESMPLNVQIKLLRVLSSNRITRVGGLEELPVDLRIIAATKKDLLIESKEGNFRMDLYYRIQVMELKIPPLRQRKEDIPAIIEHMTQSMLKQLNQRPVNLSKPFMDAIMVYNWPGNIRELGNVIERALILRNDEDDLTLEHLTDDIISQYTVQNMVAKSKQETSSPTKSGLYHRFERILIENIIEEEGGNLVSAAKRLGLSRQTLYRKIRWQ